MGWGEVGLDLEVKMFDASKKEGNARSCLPPTQSATSVAIVSDSGLVTRARSRCEVPTGKARYRPKYRVLSISSAQIDSQQSLQSYVITRNILNK